jgi:hypothetical protein
VAKTGDKIHLGLIAIHAAIAVPIVLFIDAGYQEFGKNDFT